MYYMLSSVTERPEEVLAARPDQPAPVVHFYCPHHGLDIGSRAICPLVHVFRDDELDQLIRDAFDYAWNIEEPDEQLVAEYLRNHTRSNP